MPGRRLLASAGIIAALALALAPNESKGDGGASGLWLFEQPWQQARDRSFTATACSECHFAGGAASSPAHGLGNRGLVLVAYRGGRKIVINRFRMRENGIDEILRIPLAFHAEPFAYPDGSRAELLRPDYSRVPVPAGTVLSPRIAPNLIGSACVKTASRCGHRREAQDLTGQIAEALNHEMGVAVGAGSGAQMSDVHSLATYLRELALGSPPSQAAGKEVFERLGCAACHAQRPGGAAGLHDLGADLADPGGEHLARHREWAARSVEEIARVRQVNPAAGYLHDGRARTVEEAILWHGAKGRAARDAFVRTRRAERELVLDYLDPARGGEK